MTSEQEAGLQERYMSAQRATEYALEIERRIGAMELETNHQRKASQMWLRTYAIPHLIERLEKLR